MVSAKVPRASRVFIRAWLADLFNVNAQTLSTWISQGLLRSYEPKDVKKFLIGHPGVLQRAARSSDAAGAAKPAARKAARVAPATKAPKVRTAGKKRPAGRTRAAR